MKKVLSDDLDEKQCKYINENTLCVDKSIESSNTLIKCSKCREYLCDRHVLYCDLTSNLQHRSHWVDFETGGNTSQKLVQNALKQGDECKFCKNEPRCWDDISMDESFFSVSICEQSVRACDGKNMWASRCSTRTCLGCAINGTHIFCSKHELNFCEEDEEYHGAFKCVKCKQGCCPPDYNPTDDWGVMTESYFDIVCCEPEICKYCDPDRYCIECMPNHDCTNIVDSWEECEEKGDFCFDSEDYDRAVAFYTKAIEFKPGEDYFYNMRGLAYFNLDQFDKALYDLTKTIQLKPDAAWAYSHRGLTYEKLEQYHEALKDYDKTLEIDPNQQYAINNRIILLEQHPELKP